MAPASLEFIAFSLIVVLLYNLRSSVAWRQAVLFLASIGFLFSFSRSLVSALPFIAFLIFGYISARAMQTWRMRRVLPLLVIVTVLAFVWLKKYTFLPGSLLLPFPYVTIGLSYIFFRVLHLIVDARNDALPQKISIVSYLNYTLNFTTLVSGPIQRYQDFAEMQLTRTPLRINIMVAGAALERIIIGFFKLNVLAVFLSMAQKEALAAVSMNQPFRARVLDGIVIAASYPLYLYCNFSGYIDIVIGIARFLRLRLPENFDRPFSSENFIEFWNRWHITLSQWLRTYVYNPLLITLMRRFPSRSIEPLLGVFALFATFFLVGVWHGQTSAFIFFGVLQGLGVSLARLFQVLMGKGIGRSRYKALGSSALYSAFARGLTFTWFTFTLLWFWSTWRELGILSHKFPISEIAAVWTAIFVGATMLLAAWESVRAWLMSIEWNSNPILLSRYTRTVWGTVLVVITVAVTVLLNAAAPELVYRTF